MLFGVTNAPAVLQHLVNQVLRDKVEHFVFVYLDIIIIFSHDLVSHKKHVRSVLVHPLQKQLVVKAEKEV